MIGRIMKIADLVTNASVGIGMTRMMGVNNKEELEIFVFDGKRNLVSHINLNTMISILFEDKYIEVIYMHEEEPQNIMKINRKTMRKMHGYKLDGILEYIETEIDMDVPIMDIDSTFMPSIVYAEDNGKMVVDLHIDEYYFKSHDMKFVHDGNRWLNINSRLHSKFMKN